MENKSYAWCKNSECEQKLNCIRYTEDRDVQAVNFKSMFTDDCKWYIEKKNEVKEVEKDEENT